MSEDVYNKRFILMHGGGMDSSLLLYEILRNRHTHVSYNDLGVVHVDYGQLAAEAEYDAIKKQLSHIEKEFNLKIPSVSLAYRYLFSNVTRQSCLLFTGNLGDPVELPLRNYLLISRLAYELSLDYKPHTILVGAEPTAPNVQPLEDCTKEFFQRINATFASDHLYRNVTVEAPFLDRPRDLYVKQLFDLYDLHRDFASLIMTCWLPKKTNNGYVACGECAHCKKEQKIKIDVAYSDARRAW